MPPRALIAALLLVSLRANALDASEFHLYGHSKAGVAFDITPYGDSAAGDPESKRGFTSQMVTWLRAGDANTLKPSRVCTAKDATGQCVRWELMHPVGRCTVRLAPSYEVVCADGRQPLSGAKYTGEGLDASRVGEKADVHALYEAFLRRHDGARPGLAAVYRCKEGCKDEVPATLIFLWLGD